ncbi:OmpH family outer membrane protein [Thiohalorhabdus sp. Cl-TMA]|uniref:OmpH family outer membrane protein n=1 Tax=Thiohalorhabdus methylotrophus TaxID=3242694 RepID=A0ABV4TYV6_9GAMM
MGRFLGAVFLLIAAVGLGPGAAAAAEYKIGYVDVRQVVENSSKAQAARQDLETRVQDRQAELKEKQQKIQELRKQLKQQSSLMSEEQRKQKQRELQQAMRELRRAQQAAQEDIDAQKNQVLQDLYDRVSQIINRIGENQGYDLILTGPAAMYVANRVDLTQRVLEQLNAKGGE